MWEAFSHDPRDPANAALRASDADRDVVHQLLAEAYADGRLDREEFDSRSGAVAAARTLGELPPLAEGLVAAEPAVPVVRPPAGALAPDEVAVKAVEAWRADRREALWGFIAASTICWVIWLATGADGFAWPALVSAATGLNVLRTQFQRDDIVAQKRRSIEKRERKALEQRRRDEEGS
jgi:hypothetical protein